LARASSCSSIAGAARGGRAMPCSRWYGATTPPGPALWVPGSAKAPVVPQPDGRPALPFSGRPPALRRDRPPPGTGGDRARAPRLRAAPPARGAGRCPRPRSRPQSLDGCGNRRVRACGPAPGPRAELDENRPEGTRTESLLVRSRAGLSTDGRSPCAPRGCPAPSSLLVGRRLASVRGLVLGTRLLLSHLVAWPVHEPAMNRLTAAPTVGTRAALRSALRQANSLPATWPSIDCTSCAPRAHGDAGAGHTPSPASRRPLAS